MPSFRIHQPKTFGFLPKLGTVLLSAFRPFNSVQGELYKRGLFQFDRLTVNSRLNINSDRPYFPSYRLG